MNPNGHQVLGAHMLEVCPPSRPAKPSLEIHRSHRRQGRPHAPRLRCARREAINASLIDLGNRFRLIVNEVTAVKTPKLPSCRRPRGVECKPDFKTACAAWILAAAPPHRLQLHVKTEHIEDLAEIAGVSWS